VPYLVAVVALLATGLVSVVGSPVPASSGALFPTDFVAIEQIAPNVTNAQLGPAGSVGTFMSPCGTSTTMWATCPTHYPLCPPGSQLVRIYDFPSCWSGKNLHPDGHRVNHVVFPTQNGSCGRGRIVIPQLQMTGTYDRPVSRGFALDSFPEQLHNPVTDHAFFINVMPAPLMA
jgi:hypothetical protein